MMAVSLTDQVGLIARRAGDPPVRAVLWVDHVHPVAAAAAPQAKGTASHRRKVVETPAKGTALPALRRPDRRRAPDGGKRGQRVPRVPARPRKGSGKGSDRPVKGSDRPRKGSDRPVKGSDRPRKGSDRQ